MIDKNIDDMEKGPDGKTLQEEHAKGDADPGYHHLHNVGASRYELCFGVPGVANALRGVGLGAAGGGGQVPRGSAQGIGGHNAVGPGQNKPTARDQHGRYTQQDRERRGAAAEHASQKAGGRAQGPRAAQQTVPSTTSAGTYLHQQSLPKNRKVPGRREPAAVGGTIPAQGPVAASLGAADPKGVVRSVKHKSEASESFGPAGRAGPGGRALPATYEHQAQHPMNAKSGQMQSSANSELVSGATPTAPGPVGPGPASRPDHEMDVGHEPAGGLPAEAGAGQGGDDEEECARCGSRYAQHADQEGADMSWIGCSYEECGRWYHQVCIGMADDEYRRVTAHEDQDWFCTEECRRGHLALRGDAAALEERAA